jgi:hypothetical protein
MNAYLNWLVTEEGGRFTDPRLIDTDCWVAIKRFAYTHAIIIGEIGETSGYLDRWCYRTYSDAKTALDAWDGIGEPSGWHRHPSSGRRVSDDPKTFDDRGRLVPVGEMYHRA